MPLVHAHRLSAAVSFGLGAAALAMIAGATFAVAVPPLAVIKEPTPETAGWSSPVLEGQCAMNVRYLPVFKVAIQKDGSSVARFAWMAQGELHALEDSAGQRAALPGMAKKPIAIKAVVASAVEGFSVGDHVLIYNVGGDDLAWFVCGAGRDLAIPKAAFAASGWTY
ncbi:MAG: hypothetical protein U0575_08710 [Phycisphaerales bacterium]|jgi:opacity protein-like surface antigen